MAQPSVDPVEHYLRDLGGGTLPGGGWSYRTGVWVGLLILTLGLGAAGLVRIELLRGETPYPPSVLYRAMQLLFLNFDEPEARIPWQLEIARWLAPALSGYAIYKGLEVVLRDRFQRLGLALRYRDHVIFCGLSRKAVKLAMAYRAQGRQVVMIENDANHPMVEACRNRGLVVLIGDATNPLTLSQAQLARAERLIAIGPDLTNLEIAFQAERLLAESAPPPRAIPCFVHIEDSVVCRNLRDAEAGRDRSLVVRDYFNIDEIAACALVDWEWCPAFPAQAAGPWHLVIVGLGPTGEALVLEAARRWSGRRSSAVSGPLWITVVDPQASDRLASLSNRFPWIEAACSLRPRTLDEHDPDFDACAFLAASDAPPPARVYVVSQDEKAGLRAALLLWQRRHASGEDYPIILRTVCNIGLARLLPGADRDDPCASIGVFSLLDHACSPDLLVPSLELLARAIHERYLEQRRNQGVAMGSRPAMQPWEDLAEFYRGSNRQQAARLPRTLQLDGRRRYDIVQARRSGAEPFVFPPGDLEQIARNEHERFREERQRTNPDHQDLVSWEELTEESREIVRQQIRDWPQLLASVDLTLSLKTS